MLRLIIGILVLLHGGVHLLYFGQSQRLFELQPGMAWPDGSWALSRIFGNRVTKRLASIACLLAAFAFIAGGVGIFAQQAWWRPVVAGAAAFSSLTFILLWDGKMRKMNNQGGIGLLINVAILVSALIFRWPDFVYNSSPTSPQENLSSTTCPVTEPQWIKPPEDSAVSSSPEGYYYVNQDHSIWASTWWTGEEETYLRASEEGIKTSWFRPEGVVLEITGQRLDGSAPPLHAHVPCCYPTRFQATGLYFPI
jgi:hypothetical protein